MYAIGLRHPRDADGSAYIHGFARNIALTSTPGRTGRVRSVGIGYRSGARTGTYVAVPGSRAGGPGSGT
jgi:hypothetical protein